MDKFEEAFNNLRNTLKNLITTETPKEQVDRIAAADKALDDLQAEQSRTREELQGLKSDYINLVKSSGFKTTENPFEESIQGPKVKTLEEIAQEILKGK